MTDRFQTKPILLPALALWGWQAECLPWALGMGLLLESARFFTLRFDIRQADFNRLWNFTTLVFLGVVLYLFLAREGFENVGALVDPSAPTERLEGARKVSQTAIEFLRWMPFILYPFLLVYTWSRSETLPWSTFSLYEQSRSRRAPQAPPPEWARRRLHPANPFLALVLFASCTAVTHPRAYLPLFLGVATLALWPWRNRRYGPVAWAGLLILLAGTALAARQGLTVLRSAWMTMENRLMQGSGGDNFDQMRSATKMGVVGRLKQSGSIVLRIQTRGDAAPGLLRDAAFNRFQGAIWGSSHREFEPATMSSEAGLWRLARSEGEGGELTISRYATEGIVSLSLPRDTMSISNTPTAVILTNYLGATHAENSPQLAVYTVRHGLGGGLEGGPEPDDLSLDTLPEEDLRAIQEVSRELDLAGQRPGKAVQAVERYFLGNFDYSLWQKERPAGTNRTALSYFLRESKAGHCEYFATATALLLRTAGIPTRYAVGYSPAQRSGGTWLARGRDAHAWCLAYIDGRWVEVDNTPGSWREREAARAGWWETVSDLFSNGRYRFVKWRQEGGNWRIVVFAVGIVILSWMGWRQLRGSRWRRARRAGSGRGGSRTVPLGMDSEFFTVVEHLESSRGARMPYETALAWSDRLDLKSSARSEALMEAIGLHNRLRFDPRGLPSRDRDRLRQLAAELREEGRQTSCPK